MRWSRVDHVHCLLYAWRPLGIHIVTRLASYLESFNFNDTLYPGYSCHLISGVTLLSFQGTS